MMYMEALVPQALGGPRGKALGAAGTWGALWGPLCRRHCLGPWSHSCVQWNTHTYGWCKRAASTEFTVPGVGTEPSGKLLICVVDIVAYRRISRL